MKTALISTYTMREALMQRLLQEGYEVTILTHTNSFVSHVEKTGLKVVNIGSGNLNPVKVSKYIYNLYSALKKLNPMCALHLASGLLFGAILLPGL